MESKQQLLHVSANKRTSSGNCWTLLQMTNVSLTTPLGSQRYGGSKALHSGKAERRKSMGTSGLDGLEVEHQCLLSHINDELVSVA
jgi:hypothetical protein